MPVVSEVSSLSVSLRLNNGYDSNGNVATVSVSLPAINCNNFDPQKAYNIVNLVEPCLLKSLFSVQKLEVSALIED